MKTKYCSTDWLPRESRGESIKGRRRRDADDSSAVDDDESRRRKTDVDNGPTPQDVASVDSHSLPSTTARPINEALAYLRPVPTLSMTLTELLLLLLLLLLFAFLIWRLAAFHRLLPQWSTGRCSSNQFRRRHPLDCQTGVVVGWRSGFEKARGRMAFL